jgi:hypothetical protein
VALAGREIVVAQAAPSQAILVQDGQVYAFPDVASWRGDYTAEWPARESHPLGFVEDETPRLYHSEAAAGDLIALCATSVGRALGRDDEAAIELYGGTMLTEDLEGSADRLERLLAQQEILDGFAVVASISRLPRRTRPRFARPSAPKRVSGSSIRASHAEAVAAPPNEPHPEPAAAMVSPLEFVNAPPPAFEGVREIMITAAELMASRRRRPTPDFAMRQRALAAPGALSVSRYRDSSGLPAEWRANLPRGPIVHVPARLLAVSLILFATIGGTGIAMNRQRDREARAAASLAAVDTALKHAQDNPISATSLIAEAESALTTARQAGATGAALAQREDELFAVRDHGWNIQRLTDVERIGALPDVRAGDAVGLTLSGRTLYLAAGNLYELDADARQLVTLLSEGQAVTGGKVGDLREVSLDGGTLVASDGAATYTRDDKGHWERRELIIADVGGLRSDIPLISWGDATYGLSWDGNIVRFEQTSGGPMAEVWAEVAETPDLELARDLAIDGRIHVLLQDGRTITFSRGAQVATVSPFVTPALSSAAFLAQAPFATVFYIVDTSGKVGENVGRIVRSDADGNARQILTPLAEPGDLMGEEALTALSTAQDMVIDELTGTVYWVSSGEIWRANLPVA